MNSKVNNIAIKKGNTDFDNASIDTPEIPDATNKFTPTGGVMNPIAKLTTIKIPK